MANEYKKLSEVPIAESVTEAANVVIEDAGGIRRTPMSEIGKVKTVNGVEPDENGNVVVDIPEPPVTSVNGQTGDVVVSEMPAATGICQQLVTDEEGNATWEDKAYGNTLIYEECADYYVSGPTAHGTLDNGDNYANINIVGLYSLIKKYKPYWKTSGEITEMSDGYESEITVDGNTYTVTRYDGPTTNPGPFYIVVYTLNMGSFGTSDFVRFCWPEGETPFVYIYNRRLVDKQLDEKYIPDTIARTEDIPTPFSGSWDNLSDKPFYEVSGEMIPEQSITLTKAGVYAEATYVPETYSPIISGETYTLTLDGTIYESTAGNGYVHFDTPTTPGWMTSIRSNDDTQTYLLEETGGSTFSATIGLTGPSTIVTLDEKFIPDTIARTADLPVNSEPKSINIEWDGTIPEDADMFTLGSDINYYKFSDEVPDPEHITSAYAETSTGKTGGDILYGGNCYQVTPSSVAAVIVVTEAGECTRPKGDSFTAPSAGVYLYHVPTQYTSKCQIEYEEVHQLDEKYIPDTIARVEDIPEGFSGSWNDLTDKPFGEEKALNEVLPLGDYEFSKNEVGTEMYRASYLNDDVGNAISGVGQTVIVVFDGVTYETTVQQTGSDESIFSITLDNGTELYYYRTSTDKHVFFLRPEETGTHAMSVSLADSTIVQLEEKFVPDNVPVIQTATVGQTVVVKAVDENGKPTEWEAADMGVIIPSSTEGSTKKFKITVDDSGTLTATEVTTE